MSINCVHTVKTFSLGVDSVLRDEWVYKNRMWRKQKPGFEDTKWFEDYDYGVASTCDILECWLNYVPGSESWDDYDDFTIDFDMGSVFDAGWSEFDLRQVLSDMASRVWMDGVVHAGKPWKDSRIDAWGHEVHYYRHPAIEPLTGMLDRDFPSDLRTL
jgi:hypothetical protein